MLERQQYTEDYEGQSLGSIQDFVNRAYAHSMSYSPDIAVGVSSYRDCTARHGPHNVTTSAHDPTNTQAVIYRELATSAIATFHRVVKLLFRRRRAIVLGKDTVGPMSFEASRLRFLIRRRGTSLRPQRFYWGATDLANKSEMGIENVSGDEVPEYWRGASRPCQPCCQFLGVDRGQGCYGRLNWTPAHRQVNEDVGTRRHETTQDRDWISKEVVSEVVRLFYLLYVCLWGNP